MIAPTTAAAKRRSFVAALAVVGSLLSMGAAAQAPAWPTAKPITIVVPFAAGGATDIVARLIGEKLQAAVGQSVIVDNRAGGASAIASNYVRAAPPDGYTLYVYAPSAATNNILNPKTFNFDPVKDFTPITNLTHILMVITVNPNVPAKNIKELADLARAKPGEVTFGTVGLGQADHLAGVLLGQKAGVKFTFVPYKGSSVSTQDLIAGNLTSKIDGWATAKPLADAGKVRILAHMDPGPTPLAPNVPAVADTFPGITFGADFALIGPKGMAKPLVDRINKEVTAILKMPDVVTRLTGLGLQPTPTTPQELASAMQNEYTTYAKVIKDANIVLSE